MDEYKKELKEAISCAEHLRFDKKHPWHRNLIALYLSIIEYSDALIHSVENKKTIAIPLIFRGLLEAFVDFKNLAGYREYGNNMEASFLQEWLKVIEEASRGANVFLDAISQEEDLAIHKREHQEKLD